MQISDRLLLKLVYAWHADSCLATPKIALTYTALPSDS